MQRLDAISTYNTRARSLQLTFVAKPVGVVVGARYSKLRRLEKARNCSFGHCGEQPSLINCKWIKCGINVPVGGFHMRLCCLYVVCRWRFAGWTASSPMMKSIRGISNW
jgi:hypothetical protein